MGRLVAPECLPQLQREEEERAVDHHLARQDSKGHPLHRQQDRQAGGIAQQGQKGSMSCAANLAPEQLR